MSLPNTIKTKEVTHENMQMDVFWIYVNYHKKHSHKWVLNLCKTSSLVKNFFLFNRKIDRFYFLKISLGPESKGLQL